MVGVGTSTQLLYVGLVVLVACERVFEMYLSKRHTQQALAHGGLEVGQGHFVPMVVLHSSFLLGCVLEIFVLKRPFIAWLGFSMLGVVVLAQALRYWAIFSLGERWNIRVIVVPGDTIVTRGPYRFLKHPNYVAVMLELLALPLVHTAYITACVFVVLNMFFLRVRVRCEEAALSQYTPYREHF